MARKPFTASFGPWTRSRPHRVAVLVLPGVIPLELGIVTEVFGRDPHYDLTVCAQRRTSPVSGSGFTINDLSRTRKLSTKPRP